MTQPTHLSVAPSPMDVQEYPVHFFQMPHLMAGLQLRVVIMHDMLRIEVQMLKSFNSGHSSSFREDGPAGSVALFQDAAASQQALHVSVYSPWP